MARSGAQFGVEVLARKWILADGQRAQVFEVAGTHRRIARIADGADALNARVGKDVQYVDWIGLVVTCNLLSAQARAIGHFLHIAYSCIGWELKDRDFYVANLHLCSAFCERYNERVLEGESVEFVRYDGVFVKYLQIGLQNG